MELIKGHLDKAVAEAKAGVREGASTDTKALATRIDDTMHKHFGARANAFASHIPSAHVQHTAQNAFMHLGCPVVRRTLCSG